MDNLLALSVNEPDDESVQHGLGSKVRFRWNRLIIENRKLKTWLCQEEGVNFWNFKRTDKLLNFLPHAFNI
jgi:hypothetical protein